MTMLALAAITVSALLLVMLCRGDPKRLRAARLAREGHGSATRRTLGIAACMPGVACLLLGDTAAFLIWLGGTGIAGWFVALAFRRPGGTLDERSA